MKASGIAIAAMVDEKRILPVQSSLAARPSGTENIYKIYTESFIGTEHLKQIQAEAQAIISTAFENAEL